AAAQICAQALARAQAEQEADRLARLNAVVSALGIALTPAAAAETIVAQAMNALGAHEGAVVALADGGTTFEVVHRVGYASGSPAAAEAIRAWRRSPPAAATPIG